MLVKNNGVLYQHAANNEVISNMMDQNKQLIKKLTGLLARPVEGAVNPLANEQQSDDDDDLSGICLNSMKLIFSVNSLNPVELVN